jgi:exonuclease 3'-5' domain-containing protein 1
MSSKSPKSNTTVIDSEENLLSLLDSICSLAVEPPSLYINLEGIAVGRHGSISFLTLHIVPTKKTHLIDIHSLNEAAFSTTTASGTSLKSILESPTIPKVVFDIRNDSDALFSLFQVSVDGIIDLQLMRSAARGRPAAGLVECIEKDSPFSVRERSEWRHAKETGYRFFGPEKGGRFEVLNERPIKPEMIHYCQLDIVLFPGLYGIYSAPLKRSDKASWQDHILEETKRRVRLSQSPAYDTHSRSKVFGWDDGYICKQIVSWASGIIMGAETHRHVLDKGNAERLGDGFHNGYNDTIPTL